MSVVYAFVEGQWLECVADDFAQVHGRSEREWQLILEEWRQQHRQHGQKRVHVNGVLLAQFLGIFAQPLEKGYFRGSADGPRVSRRSGFNARRRSSAVLSHALQEGESLDGLGRGDGAEIAIHTGFGEGVVLHQGLDEIPLRSTLAEGPNLLRN